MKVLLLRILRKLKTIIRKPISKYNAYCFLNKCKGEKNRDEIMIVVSPLIGDTVYALAFLDALKKQRDKKIVVVASKKQKSLLSLYPQIDRLILIEDKKTITQLSDFYWNNEVSEVGLSTDVINGNAFFYKKCYSASNPDIIYQLRTYIYKVGLNARITYHNEAVVSNVSCIDNFGDIKERIVILNPYSNSAFSSTTWIYEGICKKLIERGFEVYTNVIKKQKAILGSKELRCSIEELYLVACTVPLIVSIRSGILDYLAPSNINMFVIYENCSNRLKQMYHLSNWECKGKICEVYPGDNNYSQKDIITEFCLFLDEMEER